MLRFGTVSQHRQPCRSDADPYPGDCTEAADDGRDQAIRACNDAIWCLQQAVANMQSESYSPNRTGGYIQDARDELKQFESL